MYCSSTNHDFKLHYCTIKCNKCSETRNFSKFGFDYSTVYIFTKWSCWLLTYILKEKLNSKICFYKNKEYIYHVGILIDNKVVDITGIHSIDDFIFISKNLGHEIEDGYFHIATEDDIKIMMVNKILNGKLIQDNCDYQLANLSSDKIIDLLNLSI